MFSHPATFDLKCVQGVKRFESNVRAIEHEGKDAERNAVDDLPLFRYLRGHLPACGWLVFS